MDGRGRYLDNIFIERLWRSLKQEAVYLHELRDGFIAKRVIGKWITFYNTDRPTRPLINEPLTRHTSVVMKKKRRDNQTEYTSTQPQTCSQKQAHFISR